MRRRFYLGFFMIGLAVTGTAMTGGDVGETLTTGFKRAAADLPFADRVVPGLAPGSEPSDMPAAAPPAPGPDPFGSLIAAAREILAGEREGPSPLALAVPQAGEGGTMRQIAPPQVSDPAAMEAALRALARSFAPQDTTRPAVSAPGPEAAPAPEGRSAPVILRPGGGSSEGLPQVGR